MEKVDFQVQISRESRMSENSHFDSRESGVKNCNKREQNEKKLEGNNSNRFF